jgi:hypothetical protein
VSCTGYRMVFVPDPVVLADNFQQVLRTSHTVIMTSVPTDDVFLAGK